MDPSVGSILAAPAAVPDAVPLKLVVRTAENLGQDLEAPMGRADRGVRHACRHLATGEVVLASVAATEAEGRRQRVVLVTDRRVLITGARNEPGDEYGLDVSTCEYHLVGGLLTIRCDDRETTVRGVDELAGRTVSELLAAREARRSAHDAVRGPSRRIDAP